MKWILTIKHMIRKFRNLEYECATCGEKFRYKEFMLGADQDFKCKMCFIKDLYAPFLKRTCFSRADWDHCFSVEPLEEDAP